MHALYLRSVGDELGKVTNAVERSGGIEDFDRVQLHRVLDALTKRHEEALSILESTMMERERKISRPPQTPSINIPPPLPQPSTPPVVEVFATPTLSFWDRLKQMLNFARKKK